MIALFLDVAAAEALTAQSGSEPATATRVDELLDVLSENPGDQRVRRRLLRATVAAQAGLQGPLFGFTVRGRTHDILVIWQLSEDGIDVRYLGPDL